MPLTTNPACIGDASYRDGDNKKGTDNNMDDGSGAGAGDGVDHTCMVIQIKCHARTLPQSIRDRSLEGAARKSTQTFELLLRLLTVGRGLRRCRLFHSSRGIIVHSAGLTAALKLYFLRHWAARYNELVEVCCYDTINFGLALRIIVVPVVANEELMCLLV